MIRKTVEKDLESKPPVRKTVENDLESKPPTRLEIEKHLSYGSKNRNGSAASNVLAAISQIISDKENKK